MAVKHERSGTRERVSNNRHNSMLTPELKGWLDNVVVPALVREYLAEQRPENGACSQGEPLAECAATSATSANIEGGR